jgi:hypothetical protein
MGKKLEKPCKNCKGRSRRPCCICGWSLPKRKRNDTRSFLEQAKERGIIDRVEFLETIAIKGNKFNMEGTGSKEVDQTLKEEIGYKFPKAGTKIEYKCSICRDRGYYYSKEHCKYIVCLNCNILG